LKYTNLEYAVATWLLQDMHMYSDTLNTTSSLPETVWIDVILSYGRRRNQNWSWGTYLFGYSL